MRPVGVAIGRGPIPGHGNALREAFAAGIGEKRHTGIIASLPAPEKRNRSRTRNSVHFGLR